MAAENHGTPRIGIYKEDENSRAVYHPQSGQNGRRVPGDVSI